MSPTGDLLVTFIFLWGRRPLELAQRPSCVALVLHIARRSTPFWVTIREHMYRYGCRTISLRPRYRTTGFHVKQWGHTLIPDFVVSVRYLPQPWAAIGVFAWRLGWLAC